MTNTTNSVLVCPDCRDTGRIVFQEFDGRTVVPCPSCAVRDPFRQAREQARAVLAREYTSNPNRQQKRASMRAPRG